MQLLKHTPEPAESARPASGRDEGDGRCGDQTATPPSYAFVGERRSRRAIRLGVCWEDGRLAGRTLHAALRAAGLEPELQIYRNVYRDDEPRAVDPAVLAELHALAAAGGVVVGMGRAAQAALDRAGVPHLRLIHPAARGAIRAGAVHQAHVAAVLGDRLSPSFPNTVIDGRRTAYGQCTCDRASCACTRGDAGALGGGVRD